MNKKFRSLTATFHNIPLILAEMNTYYNYVILSFCSFVIWKSVNNDFVFSKYVLLRQLAEFFSRRGEGGEFAYTLIVIFSKKLLTKI